MRYFGFSCLLILSLCTSAQAQLRSFASVDRLNRHLAGRVVDYTHNHGEDHRIASPILGQPRDAYVYLPPCYDPAKAYPLVLYFHIARVDEHDFIGSGRLRELDKMIQAGTFPHAIVVCPDGTINGKNRLTAKPSFYINGVNGRFEDHVMSEVIPFVMSHYAVRAERESHAILGISGGGYGALSIAIRRRDFFGVAATMAAPVNLSYDNCHDDVLEDFHPETYRWETEYEPDRVVGRFYGGLRRVRAQYFLEPIFGSRPEEVLSRVTATNPASLIDQSGLQPGELAIYLHYAGRDGYNFDAHNQSFAWLAAQRGIKVTLESDPDAEHGFRYFRRNHGAAFRWLGQHLAP